jgi:S-DNA-T family DNA segregation ATPase FtsK/SpoIIIE
MAYRGEDAAPLLPASLQDRLTGWLWKALGLLVLAACAALSASLLTWSMADPSLNHVTSGRPRNLLGPPGAVLSDLVMQMLGLAGVFALLPPLFWGIRLLTAAEPPSLRGRLLLAPLAVLFLAGALSSLPAISGWPLHHGYGGVLGDLGLGLLSGLLAHVNPDRSAAAAGLFYFAAGLLVLMGSLGLTRHELRLICQTQRLPSAPRLPGAPRLPTAASPSVLPALERAAGWWRVLRGQIVSLHSPAEATAPDPRLVREPPAFDAEHPRLEDEDAPIEAVAPESPEPVESGRGAAFDASTDRHTRTIAERFAPAGAGEVRNPPPELRDPPELASPAPPLAAETVPRAAPRAPDGPCRRPPLSLLKRPPAIRGGMDEGEGRLAIACERLALVLEDLGIGGTIAAAHRGPVVTVFEFEPARGVAPARVIGRAGDVARAMGAAAARIALLPGRTALAIELASPRREKVLVRELLEAAAFHDADAALPLALGKDAAGAPVIADLARMPNLLVAGGMGSGKSVALNAMLLSLLYRLSPDQCRLVLIDLKMAELSAYDGIPHLLCPVVGEPARAAAALGWLVAETEERHRRLARLAVPNIGVFNNRLRHAQRRGEPGARGAPAPMPAIVMVVDEIADLMLAAGPELEAALRQLVPRARAAGIHLVATTRRPTADVVAGAIKAAFPARLACKTASRLDSRAILGEDGAEQLLGQGDMLLAGGGGRTQRVHGAFVSEQEVDNVAAFLREEGEPRYVEGIAEPKRRTGAGDAPSPAADDLYDRAVALVLRERKATIGYLTRRLAINPDRAAGLLERMAQEGVVGAPDFKGRRAVLLDDAGGAP